MDSNSLAKSFIECFCEADLNGIDSLLSKDFRLKGPLFEFESKQDYIASLNGDLKADPEAEILSIIGNGNEVAAFYKYKGKLIAQLFRCSEGKIDETVLVFDTNKIA